MSDIIAKNPCVQVIKKEKQQSFTSDSNNKVISAKNELKSLQDSLSNYFTPTGGIRRSRAQTNFLSPGSTETNATETEYTKPLEVMIDCSSATSSSKLKTYDPSASLSPGSSRHHDRLEDALSPYFFAKKEHRRTHKDGEYSCLIRGRSTKRSESEDYNVQEVDENNLTQSDGILQAYLNVPKNRARNKFLDTKLENLVVSNGTKRRAADMKKMLVRRAVRGKKIPRGSSHIKTVEPVSSSIISRKTVTNKSICGHSHSRPFIKPFLASSNHSQHQKADISTSMEIPEEHKKMFEEARKIVQKESEDAKEKLMSGTKIHPSRIRIHCYEINAWYSSPYPQEYATLPLLHICESCLMYLSVMEPHKKKCRATFPPGNEIYRDTQRHISIFEVDGNVSKMYCRNLCLLAKCFIDHKTLYFDVEPFLFYVLIKYDEYGCHFVGYFSKEKYSHQKYNYNLACIVTLPCYQGSGYGRFLIDFSYLISRRENLFGTPERPLSELGEFAYQSYWRSAIYEYFYTSFIEARKEPVMNLSLNDICKETGITAQDLANTMKECRMLIMKDGTLNFVYDVDELKEHWQKVTQSKTRIWINESLLKWTPRIFSPTPDVRLLSPTLSSTVSPMKKPIRHRADKKSSTNNDSNAKRRSSPKKANNNKVPRPGSNKLMKKAVSSGLSSKNGDTNSISNTCKTDGDKLSIKYSSSSDDEKGSRLRKPYSLKTPINKNGSSLVHQTPVTVNENKSTTQRSCVISSGLQSYNDNTCKSISTDLSDTSSDYKTSKKIQKPRQKLMRHAFGSREKQRPKIRYHAEESATSESDSGSDDYIVPSKYRRRMIKRSTDADDQHRNSKTDGSESDGIKSSHSTLIKAAVVDVVKTVCVKEDKGRAESINEEETTSTSTSPGPIEECQNNFLKICYEEHRSETINMGGEPDTMNMGGEPEAGTELVGPNSNALIEVSNALTDTPLSIGGADGEFRDGDLAITPYEYTGQKITPLCCQKIQVEKTNLSGWPHEGEKKHNERSSPTNAVTLQASPNVNVEMPVLDKRMSPDTTSSRDENDDEAPPVLSPQSQGQVSEKVPTQTASKLLATMAKTESLPMPIAEPKIPSSMGVNIDTFARASDPIVRSTSFGSRVNYDQVTLLTETDLSATRPRSCTLNPPPSLASHKRASFEDDKHTTTRMATTSSHSLTNTHFGQSSDPLQHISASSSNQHKKLMSLNSSSSVVNAHDGPINPQSTGQFLSRQYEVSAPESKSVETSVKKSREKKQKSKPRRDEGKKDKSLSKTVTDPSPTSSMMSSQISHYQQQQQQWVNNSAQMSNMVSSGIYPLPLALSQYQMAYPDSSNIQSLSGYYNYPDQYFGVTPQQMPPSKSVSQSYQNYHYQIFGMGPVAIPQHPSVSTLTPTTAPNFWAQQDANTQQAMQQLYSAGVQYTHGFPQNYIGNA